MRWDQITPEMIAKEPLYGQQLRLFARYCQQTVGTPVPQGNQYPALARKVKAFFIEYPAADWYTLCRIAHWCTSHKVRPRTTVGLVSCFRSAWADGALSELDPQSIDLEVERRIEQALDTELDEVWRDKLLLSRGVETRRKLIEQWEERSARTARTATSATRGSTASSTANSSTTKKSRTSAKRGTNGELGVIVLDLGLPPERPLSTNESNRMHWAQRERKLEPWRKAAWALAQQQKLAEKVGGRQSKVTVVIPFRTKTKRDPSNYVGTVVKSVVDGLVTAGVWPDDDPRYVEIQEPSLVIGRNAEVHILVKEGL
jgi:Holliday junction resolvase RusA-like endonuclease